MRFCLAVIASVFLIIFVSSEVYASGSAVGKVFVYNGSEVQRDAPSGGGGSPGRNVTIHSINLSNGSIELISENITIPTPKADEQRKTLFDIGLRIAKKQIFADENLAATISLINLGVPGRVNVTVTYRIIDSTGITDYTEYEEIEVETQKEFIKTFDISRLDEGEYTLLAEIEYEGQKEPARADDSFEVQKRFMQKFGKIIVYVAAELILAALIVLFAVKDWLKLKMLSKKVHARHSGKSEHKKRD